MDSNERFSRFISEYDGTANTKGCSLYNDMPELYETFFAHHRDYDAQLALIEEYTEVDADDILVEGACGVGLLLEKLDDEPYTTYGFDTEPEMLQIAEQNTEATLFRSNLTDFFIPKPIDCFVALGNPLFHLNSGQRQMFFEQVYKNMSNRSTLVFSFSDENDTVDGESTAAVYEIDNWKIRRNAVSVDDTDKTMQKVYSYRITDTARDMMRLQVGFSMYGYAHDTQEIQEELENLGFTNITVMKPDALEDAVVVARKVS